MSFSGGQTLTPFRRFCFRAALIGFAIIQASAAVGQDRALIVAIDRYAEEGLAQLPANLAKNDAEAIRSLLIEKLGYKPDEIKVLRNEEATRDAVLGAFSEWLDPLTTGAIAGQRIKGLDESGALNANKTAKKKEAEKKKYVPPSKVDRSYFYFSGLGYFQADADLDEKDGQDETIVPYDAKVAPGAGAAGIEGAISDDEIAGLLEKFRYRDVTLVLDTGHSGIVTRGNNLALGPVTRMRAPAMDGAVRSISGDARLLAHKSEGPYVDVDIKGGSITVWSAASPTQTALIAGRDDAPHGLFTLLYVEGIQTGKADANANGIVSNAELLRHIAEGSEVYCIAFRERCEMGLRPRLDPAPAYGRSAWIDRKKAGHAREHDLSFTRLLDFLGTPAENAVSLVQSPASPLYVGAKDIRYRIASPYAGHLVLLNLTDNEELFQFYPNHYAGRVDGDVLELMKAGTPIEVPDPSYGVTYNATVPIKGHVVAIVTPDPVRFDPSVTRRVIMSVTRDESIGFYLARLAAALHAPVGTDSAEADTRSARWTLRALPYEILP